MKEPVGFDYFTRFCFPYGLAANGAGALCFGVRRASLAQNRYLNSLWVWRGGRARRLQGVPKEFSGHWWWDDEHLLVAQPLRGKTLAQLPGTRLWVLNIQHGAARQLAELRLDVTDALPLGNGRALLHAAWNPDVERVLDEAGGDAKKTAAALREEADAEVLTRLPFWADGEGFAGQRRGRLYVLEKGVACPLTGEEDDVECVRLTPDAAAVWAITRPFGAAADAANRLMRLDLSSGEATDCTFRKRFRHDAVTPLEDGSLLVAGSDMRRFGTNQNPAFYRLSPGGNVRALYTGGGYSGWQSVSADLAMPDEPRWFARGKWLYWVSAVNEESAAFCMDTKTGAIAKLTKEPGAVQEIAWLHDAKTPGLAFIAMRGLAGPELYQLLPNGEEKPLTALNTTVREGSELARPRLVRCIGYSGAEIRGWVLCPPSLAPGGRCPAVLMVHGGPKMLYGNLLFHEMQLLAARGFGVLFCNPTGSDGRGDAFADLRGRWGGPDFEDLLAFTGAALAECPWMDERRLGISGGSYGGFLVNWAVGRTRRFTAAVSQRGIANWVSACLLSDIGHYYLTEQAGGDAWGRPQALWRASPLAHAPNVKTPTLFLHSEKDYRCPLPEGLQMYAALKRYGAPTRLVLFRGEGHALSRSGRPKARLRRLQEIVNWFEKYLKIPE